MKSKRPQALLTLAFLFSLLFPTMGRSDQTHEFIWKGSASNQVEEFIQVVETREAWDELWWRAFDRPAPSVDFEKNVVACVFLGHNADWLYSIGFGRPYRRGEVWIIPYELAELIMELSSPFKAYGQYAMEVIEKKPGRRMILELLDQKSRQR